jgi:hypothetical protein
MIKLNVHELLKKGQVEEIFNGFNSQFDNVRLYGWKEGKRKAASSLQKNDNGEMLIHLLAGGESGQNFQKALNYGEVTDINIITKTNLTPIHYAIKSGNIYRIEHIVRLGANILGLAGKIEGLAKYADIEANVGVAEYLRSNQFKELVNMFADKAHKIAQLGKVQDNTQSLMTSFVQKVRPTYNQAVEPIVAEADTASSAIKPLISDN